MFFRFFFFKQKTAYEMRISDWSSDVCSSDLSVLKVQGETTKSIKSPNAPPAPASPEAAPDSTPSPTGESSGGAAQTSEGQAGGAQVIAQAIDTAAAAAFSGKIGRPERIDIAISERSEAPTSELQSLMRISYAVFCLKKKTINNKQYLAALNTT